MTSRTSLALVTVLFAAPALADGITTYTAEGSFDDVSFAVENAIIGQGLVIDYTSHVGDMLARTGADVGSDVALFDAADVYIFCSATASRSVMEADLMNIAYCPYGIFVADTGTEVLVGYRNFPEGPMQEVQSLLDGIVEDALSN